jgi:soluble lytic murein transglycosylase-like protein
MAVPRIHPPAGSNGIGLPQPLAPSEAARIRRIFALQRHDKIPDAVAETARLNDDTLLGHILADRMLARPSRASAPALAAWLGRYADLPDACAIYALLLRRLPAGAKPPAPPQSVALGTASAEALRGAWAASAAPARAALVRGRDAVALRLGRQAFDRSQGQDGEAAYVAGLAAWRLGSFAQSGALFDSASVAQNAGAGLRAAASYWAARAYFRLGDILAWRPRMLRAAAEPHTLHGMLARRVLGLRQAVRPATPTLGEADVEAIAATPQGRRAFALLQVGEPGRAEAELRLLWADAQGNPPLSRALFLVAAGAGLHDLAADLSGVVDATEADLPVPELRPAGGYSVDPALIYAIAHVESNFDARAQSGSGAYGLMQLMPVTARTIAGKAGFSLRNSAQNLRIGQAYLAYLAKANMAGDDLLRVLASYNSGPSAVQKWDAARQGDPLLFLELIPNDETRHFVQRTLQNLWGYAQFFNLEEPSLDAIVAGIWPRWSPETEVKTRVSSPVANASLH